MVNENRIPDLVELLYPNRTHNVMKDLSELHDGVETSTATTITSSDRTFEEIKEIDMATALAGRRKIMLCAPPFHPSWAEAMAKRIEKSGISGGLSEASITTLFYGDPVSIWPYTAWEPELNAVTGGKEKSLNPILLDRYKKGKQPSRGKRRKKY